MTIKAELLDLLLQRFRSDRCAATLRAEWCQEPISQDVLPWSFLFVLGGKKYHQMSSEILRGAGGPRIFVGEIRSPENWDSTCSDAHSRNASHGEDCVEAAGTRPAAESSAAVVFHM